MADERQFMQLLREITEIARANDNFITTRDINDYFEEMDLDETQKEAIYDYLCKGHITVKGFAGKVENSKAAAAADMANDIKGVEELPVSGKDNSSARTSAYRKKVRELKDSLNPDFTEIHIRLSENGDETVIGETISAYLPVVVNMASKYTNRGVAADELIQEGNLALIIAVRELAGNKEITEIEKYIKDRIRESIINIIDSEQKTGEGLATAMGKAGLVYEASNHLAESLGKVATLRELSEFTHIPEDEIEDIVNFSGYAIKYSK